MADQRDVQQLIQSLTPSGVNNGNPNTSYNNGATPMMDAFGNWSMPQVNPAASISFNRAAPSLPPSTALNLPRLPSGVLGSTPVPGGGVVTTPSTGGGGITPYTPPVQAGTGSTPAAGGSSPSVSLGGQTGNQTLPGNLLNNLPPVSSYQGALPTSGSTSGSTASGRGLWDSNPWLAQQLGVNPDGGFDWQQILDVISEPFVRGDFWNSQTNTWNPGTAAATLGKMAGVPFSNLIGGLIGNPDAAKNNAIGNLLESMANDRQTLLDQTNQESLQYARDYLADQGLGISSQQKAYNQAVANAWNTAIDRHNTVTGGQGTGFGVGVIGGYYFNPTTGKVEFNDAGQQMFDAMKMGQMGVKQTGGDIYGRLYER